jgi:indolepyruvate ferredoxin oxidoreductase beta subunit
VNQQIIVSGLGGQGILFVTRVIAEGALIQGHDVLTSETHGMAMRGGTVISHVKVGPYRSPLIRSGHADLGLFLNHGNLAVHGHFISDSGRWFVNTSIPGDYENLDASKIAGEIGSLVVSNLVLLRFAVGQGALFADAAVFQAAIERTSSPRQLELNLKAFEAGLREIRARE